MTIDIQRLRRDLANAGYGAFYGGGFGGGLMGAFDANSASPQKLVEMAERMGFDISDYAMMDYESDYGHTDLDEWDDDYDDDCDDNDDNDLDGDDYY